MSEGTERKPPAIGMIGILVGGLALLLALIHAWAGPFAPEATLEETVTDAARSIRDAAVAAWKGEDAPEAAPSGRDIDDWIDTATVALGGLALVLGVAAFARRESWRGVLGAAFLGMLAVGFEFVGAAIGAVVAAMIVLFVLSQLGLA